MVLWLGLLAASACSRAACGAQPPARALAFEKKAMEDGRVVTFTGACDASGVVSLAAEQRMIVADDENNVLRAYDVRKGGAPLFIIDASEHLRVPGQAEGKKKKKRAESDLEAGAVSDGLMFWIGSHGRNSSGKPRPERSVLFASTLEKGDTATFVGTPYFRLLEDLFADPAHARFALDKAAEQAPKDEGALNIEAMSARREGGVWLGFRNPSPGGKALLTALLNPAEVIRGQTARFAAPVLLDFGGRGIRDMVPWRAGYLIIAGAHDQTRDQQVFEWDGTGQPRLFGTDELSWMNAEALFVDEARGAVLVLSDDGTREIGGSECKQLADAAQKQFRGLWLSGPRTQP
jgi:hypothetical protein